MKETTKKRILVCGGIALSLALIFLIVSNGAKKEIIDESIQEQEMIEQETYQDGNFDIEIELDDSGIKVPEIELEDETIGGVDTGTEQTIQPDVVKPTYTEEQLTNPDVKPNGEVATEEDRVGETAVVTPNTSTSTSTSTSSGGLPGFDNVPNLGSNTVVNATDMYENGNKVGVMD